MADAITTTVTAASGLLSLPLRNLGTPALAPQWPVYQLTNLGVVQKIPYYNN